MTRVLVAAIAPIARAGLESLLTTQPDLTVVGRSVPGPELVERVLQLQPEVLVLDLDSLEDDLGSRLADLAETASAPALVVLVDEPLDLPDLLRSGVQAVLSRDATPGEIVAAIQAVAAGLVVIHPTLLEALLPADAAPTQPAPTALGQALTPREVEVLGMLAEGLGNKTIARRLSISEHTVKFHVASIFQKLQVSSRTEAVMLGARQGLILL